MPKISVIIPVYNAEKYLCRCIDSIVNQTYTDFELILVNDGSRDKSGSICDEYAKNYLGIKVIHQKNQGQSVARNNALKIANGDFFTFVDSDDCISCDYLLIMYQNIKKYDADICVVSKSNSFDFIKQKKGIINVFDHRSGIEYFGKLNDYKFRAPWGKLIKRDIVLDNLFPEQLYNGEDFYVIHLWLNRASIIVDCDIPLYYYNEENAESITNGAFNFKKTDDLVAYESLLLFLFKNNYSELYKSFFEEYLIQISCYIEEIKKMNKKKYLLFPLVFKLRKGLLIYRRCYSLNDFSEKNYLLRTANPSKELLKKKIKKIIEKSK